MTYQIRYKIVPDAYDVPTLSLQFRPVFQRRWKKLFDGSCAKLAKNSLRNEWITFCSTEDRLLALKSFVSQNYGGSMEQYVKAFATEELRENRASQTKRDEAFAFEAEICSFRWNYLTVTEEELTESSHMGNSV